MRVRNAFTLAELLAVIAIIALIAAIAIPVVNIVMENSKKEMFKDNAKALIRQALYEKISDDSLDLTQINTENMHELLDKPSDNYASIVFEDYDDEILIKVIGANKWEGLAVCGTNATLKVAEDNCEFDSEAPTIVYSPNGSASYIKSGNVKITVTDELLSKTSLKYVWTTTINTPSDEEYTNTFTNRGNIPMPKSTGRFYLHIIAKDLRNNTTRQVRDFLIDNEAPIITMNGANPVNISAGSTYTDAGATALDNVEGNITSKIAITGTVNPSILGTYTITYNVSDNAGNTATPVVRTVNVIDDIAPTIAFGTNGNSTYAKSRSTTVTVSDAHSSVNTSSLKYQWTTSTSQPTEASFTNSFTNGGTLNTPAGVTGGYYLWILAKDTPGNTKISRSNVFNLDNTLPVITMNGSSPISITIGSVYTDAGATASDAHSGLNGSVVATGTVNVSIAGTYYIYYNVSDNAGNAAAQVTRTVNVVGDISGPGYIASKGVNGPILFTGMTPIKWNGSSWVDTTVLDSDWYDYTTTDKKWANVRTADGSMWVWIPRYIYKISSGWHADVAGTIDVQFTKSTNDNWNSSIIGNIDAGTTSNASNNKWTNHPAFTFGTTELTGIWVAKFEASGTTTAIDIKPNVTSIRSMTIGNTYIVARNMESNTRYGWGTTGSTLDTHLIKNVEWGAIAYLAQSTYGKNTELYKNNSNTFITGCSGGSPAAAAYAGCQYTYDTANGQGASTTGNIYGIYDMSGEMDDFTAAYVDNGNASLTTYGKSIINANNRYKDIYTKGATENQQNNYALTINKKGDALYEVSSYCYGMDKVWQNDFAYMALSNSPWLNRGGNYATARNGMFSFDASDGSSGKTFRPVIVAYNSPAIAFSQYQSYPASVVVSVTSTVGVDNSSLKYYVGNACGPFDETIPAESTFTQSFTNNSSVTAGAGTFRLWVFAKDVNGNSTIALSDYFGGACP